MKVQKDKLVHAGACAAIAAGAAVALRLLGSPAVAAGTGGVMAAMAAGAAKEYGDRPTTGWDWADIAADAIGAVAGGALGYLSL